MRKLLLLFTVIIVVSCGSDDKESPSKKIIPSVMRNIYEGEENWRWNMVYGDDYELSTVVSSLSNDNIEFIYNSENLITKITDFNGGYPVIRTYEYNSDQKLIKATLSIGGSTNAHYYSYNTNGTVEFQNFDSFGDIYNHGTILLNNNGDIIEVKTYEDRMNNILSNKLEVTYDDKNSIYKNIPGLDKLLLDSGIDYYHGYVNNPVSIKNTSYLGAGSVEEKTISYIYNNDNYPFYVKEFTNGVDYGSYFHITYK